MKVDNQNVATIVGVALMLFVAILPNIVNNSNDSNIRAITTEVTTMNNAKAIDEIKVELKALRKVNTEILKRMPNKDYLELSKLLPSSSSDEKIAGKYLEFVQNDKTAVIETVLR